LRHCGDRDMNINEGPPRDKRRGLGSRRRVYAKVIEKRGGLEESESERGSGRVDLALFAVDVSSCFAPCSGDRAWARWHGEAVEMLGAI
jgi:hypothetical protein